MLDTPLPPSAAYELLVRPNLKYQAMYCKFIGYCVGGYWIVTITLYSHMYFILIGPNSITNRRWWGKNSIT